jgi:hypothetical protein
VTSAQATVAIKPGHRGEREISRKTIVQGMPVVPALPVVTAACLLLLQAGHGCGLHPAFPVPSWFRGWLVLANPGRIGAAGTSLYVVVMARQRVRVKSADR